jgi:sialate O-acetylesterase
MKIKLLLMTSLFPCLIFADVSLPHIFSDGMTLQRDQSVPIWGWADPGEDVSIEFASAMPLRWKQSRNRDL